MDGTGCGKLPCRDGYTQIFYTNVVANGNVKFSVRLPFLDNYPTKSEILFSIDRKVEKFPFINTYAQINLASAVLNYDTLR